MTAAPEGKKKIAFLSQGASNEWAIQFDEVAKANASKLGIDVELLYFDSQGNADTQVKQMEDAQALGADVIVLYPDGRGALVGQVERAEAGGTPVVLCAAPLQTDKYTSLVAIDWKGRYTVVGEWLAKELGGKGNIIMLDGQAGVSDSDEAGAAVRAVLAKYPDIKVVGEGYSDWSIAKAKQLTETMMAKGVQIDGAYADGGEPTMGIVQAFADAGKPVPILAGHQRPERSPAGPAREQGQVLRRPESSGGQRGLHRRGGQDPQGREGRQVLRRERHHGPHRLHRRRRRRDVPAEVRGRLLDARGQVPHPGAAQDGQPPEVVQLLAATTRQ